ncbi:ribonuclease R [Denitrovibrio acetiphilus DSM 12809]|uniref:Ribonuclease R n=1 Tax=Denitrovibrio acetiphilus (strain DSM 12809 / NBRC 114555 / N2460) TaxID=522772 RepID=D4H807_DENA2|nr:hypothetical protein [Denitrovibrio acetiphilus]ADD68156.1 ribonuclease R [Denitrovibrio acetiphilus DSM 12809]
MIRKGRRCLNGQKTGEGRRFQNCLSGEITETTSGDSYQQERIPNPAGGRGRGGTGRGLGKGAGRGLGRCSNREL